MKALRAITGHRSESGQALIFVAVLAPILLSVAALAIEGGRLFAEYRRMEAAADAAALVGAQQLPCKSDGTDGACIITAEQLACQYAQLNGYSNCSPGGASAPSANVPPVSCSPYDLDYGNASSDSSCKRYTASEYDYLEVRLAQPVSIPVFNISFNLYAHAVARHGEASARDFAVAVLDPHQFQALEFNLNTQCILPLCLVQSTGGVVVVGDQIVNSDASSAINVDGSGTEATCAGQWFTYANETTPPALASYSHSTSSFAPVGCGPATSKDNPTRFTPNFPRVDDPYAGSSTPAGNMSTNCQPCGTTGWAYHWSSLLGRAAGTWVQASALPSSITSDNWEFFPGIYPNGLDVEQGVGNLYFNPGVYTMQSDLKIKAGTVCLYGSPACAPALGNLIPGLTGVACWNASFNQLDPVYVLSSIWYHLCSPYGVWDATLPRTGGQGPATAPPTFVGSSRPLNGLTFYLQSGTFDMETPSGGYLAAPNPCPGTGNDTLLPVVSDDFLAGSDSSTSSYIYLPTSAAGQDAVLFGGPLSSPPRQLYPNVDFSTSEDKVCNATSGLGNVWQGEFAGNVVSHLHFLVFQRDPGHGIKLTTSGQQYWWGILYNPGNYASGGGCASSCAVTIAGKASSAVIVPAGVNSGVTTCNLGLTCGPPAVFGQIVADNLSYSGNVGVEVYYRPSSSVGSGPGTALVQ